MVIAFWTPNKILGKTYSNNKQTQNKKKTPKQFVLKVVFGVE